MRILILEIVGARAFWDFQFAFEVLAWALDQILCFRIVGVFARADKAFKTYTLVAPDCLT